MNNIGQYGEEVISFHLFSLWYKKISAQCTTYFVSLANSTNSTWWQRRAASGGNIGHLTSPVHPEIHTALFPWDHRQRPGGPSVFWIPTWLCALGFCWTPPRAQRQAWGSWGKVFCVPGSFSAGVALGRCFPATRCTVSVCCPRPSCPRATAVLSVQLSSWCLPSSPGAGNCSTLRLSPCHCTFSCWFLGLPAPSHNLETVFSSKLLLHPVWGYTSPCLFGGQ